MKRSFAKRLTVFLLSAVMVFTLMPWLGAQKAYADDTSVSTLTNLKTLEVDMSDGSRYYFDDHNVDPAAFVTSVMIMMDAGIIGGDYEIDGGDTHLWIDLNKDGDTDLIGGCNSSDELWWINPGDDVTLTGTKWTRSIPESTTFDSSLPLPETEGAPDGTSAPVRKYYSKLIFKFPTISDGKAIVQYASVKWDGTPKKPKVTVKLKGEKLEKPKPSSSNRSAPTSTR